MKLITFDDGRVGRLELEERLVVPLEVGSTREYFERYGRVNTFAPGFIETEMLLSRGDWKSGRREDMIAKTPRGRIPGPAELAGTALFLATDDAAHMTGAYLNADGGFNMIGADFAGRSATFRPSSSLTASEWPVRGSRARGVGRPRGLRPV